MATEPRQSLREIAACVWMDVEHGRHALGNGSSSADTFTYALTSLMTSLKVEEAEARRLIAEVTTREAMNWYVEGRRALLVPQE